MSMKDLSTYLEECGDGAATPASTIGMGNPAAPGPEGETGSGDLLTAKCKRCKKKKKKVQEGLLDDDFDVSDDHLKTQFIDELFDLLYPKQQISEQEWERSCQRIKEIGEIIALPNSKSAMATFRSKNTVILSVSTPKNSLPKVEIRKFIKNPLPDAFEYEYRFGNIMTYLRRRVNHPTQLNLAKTKLFVVPEEVWTRVVELSPWRY